MPVPEVEEVGSLNGRQPEVAGSQRPIPDVEQTSEAKAAAANGCRAGPHTAQQIPEDVIVIADDDDSEESDDDGSGYGDGDSDDPSYHGSSNADSDEEGCESDATSRKVPDAPQHARRMHFTRYNSDNPSAVPPQTAEDSDDDCQVISEMPPRQQRAGSAAAKAFPSHITVDEDTGRADAQDCSASDSDSDCEIVDASQPEFRRQWEEAALRRRMSSVLKSEASNVGRGPTTDFRSDSPVSSRDRGGASPHPSSGVRERHSFRHAQTRAESVATSTDTDVGKTCKEHLSAEGQKGNHSKWDGAGPSYVRDGMGDKPRAAEAVTPTEAASTSCQAGDVIEEDLCSYPAAAAAATDDVKPYAPAGAALSGQSREPVVDMRFDACGHESELPDFHAQSELLQQELPMPPGEAVVDREKMKETDEFRQADDAEWARRNIELQRQVNHALQFGAAGCMHVSQFVQYANRGIDTTYFSRQKLRNSRKGKGLRLTGSWK